MQFSCNKKSNDYLFWKDFSPNIIFNWNLTFNLNKFLENNSKSKQQEQETVVMAWLNQSPSNHWS